MRRRKVVGLSLLLLLLSLIGVSGWLTYRQMRQDYLNHALIAAIKRKDVAAGLTALTAGADPNSREDANQPLSFWQSLRRLFTGMRRHGPTSDSPQEKTAL